MTVNNNSEKKPHKSGSGSVRNEKNKLKTRGLSYKSKKNVDVLAQKVPSSEVRTQCRHSVVIV
jgi:hypothetical protein